MSELEKNTLETEIKASKKVSNIRKDIKGLTLVEVSELIEGVKEDFQIKEEALIQATATPAEEKKEEKTGNVSVKWIKIKTGGLSQIKVYGFIMEAVKELKGENINIIQAKKLTEKEDKIILENVPRDKAEELQKKIESGAEVEIK